MSPRGQCSAGLQPAQSGCKKSCKYPLDVQPAVAYIGVIGRRIDRPAGGREMNNLNIGDRVKAGEGDDCETGTILDIDLVMAVVEVEWDSDGTRGPCNIVDIRLID